MQNKNKIDGRKITHNFRYRTVGRALEMKTRRVTKSHKSGRIHGKYMELRLQT